MTSPDPHREADDHPAGRSTFCRQGGEFGPQGGHQDGEAGQAVGAGDEDDVAVRHRDSHGERIGEFLTVSQQRAQRIGDREQQGVVDGPAEPVSRRPHLGQIRTDHFHPEPWPGRLEQ
ncbi:hypothetical protein [Streptosporangium sp. NPDC049376]|uniref:hypothetical protein n=1 Tax=Streptosporangium sp. NPDC049376 TaxID=3366192 RepID=UPI0037B52CE1